MQRHLIVNMKNSKFGLKKALKKKLSAKELLLVRKSFDSLGNIAVIEVPKELEKKEKVIAETLLETHKRIETVVKKTGAHKGRYRIEPVKYLAGKKSYTAFYKEYCCTYRISLGKTYFSPRLSSERKRVSDKVKKGEVVAVFFAGIGPFAVLAAKTGKPKKVYAIEWNPNAVKDLKYNIEKNKVEKIVKVVKGDVEKEAKELERIDRIVMPLPEGGEKHLNTALKALKKEGTIHYYDFSSKEKPFKEPVSIIAKACRKSGRKFRVLEKKTLSQYSKDIVETVVDVKVY